MRLLFLDIDGVLNGHERFPNRYTGIDYARVQHLNRILAEVPDLQIVLSSAWRYVLENDFLAMHVLCGHGVDCFERVHGVTERDPVPDDHPPFDDVEWWSAMGLVWRKGQIEAYVEATQPARFAVLDDLPLGCEHLFQTDGAQGLTGEMAEAVIRHFGTAGGL